MNSTRAREILQSLADGLDPTTHIPFPPDSPYQQANTVRALHAALTALDHATACPVGSPPISDFRPPTSDAIAPPPAHPSRRPIDPNRPKLGLKWTPEEEQQLRDAFTAQKTIPEIAATHGRSCGGITSRLVKLGLIEDAFAKHPGHRPRPQVDRPTVSPASAADAPASPPISDFRPPTSGAIAPPRNPKPDDDLPF